MHNEEYTENEQEDQFNYMKGLYEWGQLEGVRCKKGEGGGEV